MTKWTAECTSAVEKFCEAVKRLPPEKAVIAAVAANSFISGMSAQEGFAADNEPQQAQM